MLSSTAANFVLCARERLVIGQIGAWAARLWPVIEAELTQYGLTQTGPTVFVSHGRDGSVDRPFEHAFCVPVDQKAAETYAGAFQLTTLPAVEHASATLVGPLTREAMARAYQACVDEINAAGRDFSGETREVYHHWSGPEAADNRVEIVIVCR